MTWLRSLQHTWTVGFAVLFCLGLMLLGFAMLAVLALMVVGWVIPIPEEHFDGWLMVSALIWAPLAVGTGIPTIARWRNLDQPEPEPPAPSLYG